MENYEVGKLIGKGKFGNVYLGRNKNKQNVAIKAISKIKTKYLSVDQINIEINILKMIDHNNIIKFIDNFKDNHDNIYVVTNYVDGINMFDMIKTNNIKTLEPLISKYLLQLINAVEYLHGMNIIHRDIKPENIIVTNDNNIVLCDFGWSVIAESLHTKHTILCGTLDYICPEMASGKEYDYRCDIWNIGVLTYELLTKKAPFYASGWENTCNNISKLKYTIPPELSSNASDFISRLLKYQENRMSFDEMKSHPFIYLKLLL